MVLRLRLDDKLHLINELHDSDLHIIGQFKAKYLNVTVLLFPYPSVLIHTTYVLVEK